MSNSTVDRTADPDYCWKHAGGHCWHQAGEQSFKGKDEVTCPVVCCHCKVTARKWSTIAPTSRVIYD